jgi:hypothetical protein
MDPVTLVAAALATAVARHARVAATEAVGDAYAALKGLLARRLSRDREAAAVLEKYEEDPSSWAMILSRSLAETGVADDAEVIDAAQRLLVLLDDSGSRSGRYFVDVRGLQGIQVGAHNTQTNTFSTGPNPKE